MKLKSWLWQLFSSPHFKATLMMIQKKMFYFVIYVWPFPSKETSCFVQIFFFSLSSSFFSLAFPACVLLLFKKGNVHKVLSFYSFTTQSSWGETKNFMNQKVLLEKKEEEKKKDCWGHLAPLFLMVSRFPRALVASFYAVSSHFHSVFIFISFWVQRSWRAIIFTLFKYFPFFFFSLNVGVIVAHP